MRQVFEGVKVAAFTWSVSGPLTVKYLADHGAEVIRIESSIHRDVLRTYPPFKDNIPEPDRAGRFANNNANVYGITLNLNHPKGLAIAKRIVAWSDIVAESFMPGIMARWGLDYEHLKEIKPDIIMLSSSNLGQTGPAASQAGFGTTLVALAGFVHLHGWPDREPSPPQNAYTDVIAPPFGAAALIAALCYRRRTGKGQYIDVSQYETSVHFLAPLILDFTVNGRVANRMGNRCSYAAPHGAYPCQEEDRWCAIAVFSDEEWHNFCHVIGNPAWTEEPRFSTLLSRKQNEDELDSRISEWTKQIPVNEVMLRMQSAGVAAGVVRTCEDIHYDPQLLARGFFQEVEHPVIGRHHYEGPGFKLSKTPSQFQRPAPCLGQHNEHVYTKILGIPDEEFAELLAEGVFD